MEGNNLIIIIVQTISILISTIATGVIAYYAVKANKLSKEIKKLNDKSDKRDKKFKNQLKGLYKAIVISNLQYAGQSTEQKLADFKQQFENRDNYFGEIFDDL